MNKVCVVTGGAAGIGRCIVEMFAESGYTVYFIDKTPEAVELAEGKMSERSLSVTGFVGGTDAAGFCRLCLIHRRSDRLSDK